jgi:hypothetical protein
MVESTTLTWIYATGCQAAAVLAVVFLVALIGSRALTRADR